MHLASGKWHNDLVSVILCNGLIILVSESGRGGGAAWLIPYKTSYIALLVIYTYFRPGW